MEATMPKPARTLTVEGLGKLVLELRDQGFTVIAPTVRDGAIVNAPIESIDQLPRGVGDEQDNAHYRLTARKDGAYFGYAAGAQSMKPILFPADELIWRGKRDTAGAFSVDRDPSAGAAPYALLGVR